MCERTMASQAALQGEGPQEGMFKLSPKSVEIRFGDLSKLPKNVSITAGMLPVEEEGEGDNSDQIPVFWQGSMGLFEGRGFHKESAGGSSAGHDAKWDCSAAFCGGPIWAMDWLGGVTLFEAKEKNHQIVAVAAMPQHHMTTTAGMQVPGRNAVQIWSMGQLEGKERSMSNSPQLLFLISVNSAVIHAVAWCKWAGAVGGDRCMGLLCTAVGDGSVSVFEVPYPCKEWTKERKVLELKPKVTAKVDCGRSTLRGYSTCLQWSSTPWEGGWMGFVAAGCTTGETLVIPVTWGDAGHEGDPVILSGDDGHGVSSIEVCGAGEEVPGGGLYIATGCVDGRIRIWDIKKPHWPIFVRLSQNKGWVTGLAWLLGGASLIYCSDQGRCAAFQVRNDMARNILDRPGHMWGVHISPSKQMLAMASGEGIVTIHDLTRIYTAEHKTSKYSIKRGAPSAVACYTITLQAPSDGGARVLAINCARRGRGTLVVPERKLSVRSHVKPKGEKGDDEGDDEDKPASKKRKPSGPKEEAEARKEVFRLPDLGIGVHRVKWHPEKEGLLLWAGHAGIMFCGFVA